MSANYLLGTCVWGSLGVGFWHWRKLKLNMDLEDKRENARDDTPFYGRRWGGVTDYLYEISLNEGDMLQLARNPISLSIKDAMGKFLYNQVSGTYTDRVGLIHIVHGQRHVVFSTTSGVQCVKYCDFVANYHADLLTCRALNTDEVTRKRIFDVLEELRLSGDQTHLASLAENIEKEREAKQLNKSLSFSWLMAAVHELRSAKHIFRLSSYLEPALPLESHKHIVRALEAMKENVLASQSGTENTDRLNTINKLIEQHKEAEARAFDNARRTLSSSEEVNTMTPKEYLYYRTNVRKHEAVTPLKELAAETLVPLVFESAGLLPRNSNAEKAWGVASLEELNNFLPASSVYKFPNDSTKLVADKKAFLDVQNCIADDHRGNNPMIALFPFFGPSVIIRDEQLQRYRLRKYARTIR